MALEVEKREDQGESLDDVMRKYDRESNTRIWTGWQQQVLNIFLALISLYCIYSTLFSTALPELRLSLFLGVLTLAGYFLYPASRKHVKPNCMPWYDWVLAIVGSCCFFYFSINALSIIKEMGRLTPWEIAIGIGGLLALGELCRRCVGLPILFVAGALLIYAFCNKLSFHMPVRIVLRELTNTLFYSTSGVIGTPINVCSTFIVLFIIFGAFLERTGIAEFFISLANRFAGWSSGGPAKVAVISSALCGMVSGSSVGNTVTTGSLTIPMMKKCGYKPEFAGAVEAASSTGGQIMPPIMGAAAFLMAEYMGIPYMSVAARAILPASLYFVGIFITVHLEAKALGLKSVSSEDLPKWGYLAKRVYLLLPLVLLIYLVSTGSRTMAFAAAVSILCALVTGWFHMLVTKRAASLSLKSHFWNCTKAALKSAYESLAGSAKGTVTVAVACGISGVIAGCITSTGLASVMINAIVKFAGNATFIGLLLTMICCIVLGMGVPTTANYCIMASTCAPILIHLGFPMVSAHFFVFYFGIIADITPPVALAAYAGASIARANPMKTGLNATRLAIAAFIVPYIFVYNPRLLLENLQGSIWHQFWSLAEISVTAVCGLYAVAVGLRGYFYSTINIWQRIMMVGAGLLLIQPGLLTDLYGLCVILGVILYLELFQRRKAASI